MEKSSKHTTDFGFSQIPIADKTERVHAVFSSVASNYDLMNDLMSLGMHRLWKRIAVSYARVRPYHQILDVAGGTGDLTRLLAKQLGPTGKVTLTDINADMLQLGRDAIIDAGLFKRVAFVLADAQRLPFANNKFDCIIIGFGLRNVTDKEQALASMQRVLKPGGRLVILEFSQLILPWLQSIYDHYSFKLIPWLGEIIAGDRDSYQYLVESIRKHPNQQQLASTITAAGFSEVDYRNLSGGIVALHYAMKY